jgi:hypothetical protein
MVAGTHVDERRDMEDLGARLPDAGLGEFAGLDRRHISVTLAERVADRIDQRDQPALAVIGEIDRDRIEDVAKDAGIGEQQDARRRLRYACARQ